MMKKIKNACRLSILIGLFVVLFGCEDTSDALAENDQSHAYESVDTEVSSNANESSKTSRDDKDDSAEENSESNRNNENDVDESSSNKSSSEDEEEGSNEKDESVESQSSNVEISSGSSAIEYLKRQLQMEDNEDIEFNDMGGELKTDDNGSYYTIVLTSKSMRESGGSGTVGLYKVYEDGEYMINE
ncbi:hypothetical protein [Ornithinibacillus xuwenensis]|uniref:Lipoprotein n=1 Tax=Ornithinibacillus xuwenensis TaxID=3144668 RepID=A0ABU9XK07_9BACI